MMNEMEMARALTDEELAGLAGGYVKINEAGCYELYDEDGNYLGEGLLFRFNRDGSYLTLHSPVLHHLYETDEPIEDVEILKPFGIFNLEEVFYLEGLNDDVLVVSNDNLRLHFRRY